METILELKNDIGGLYYQLAYNAPKNYIYINWIGFATEEEIIYGAEQFFVWLENNKDKNCICFVNDNRQYRGSWGGIEEWLANVWTPTVYRLGLRYAAFVVNDDVFTQVSNEAFKEVSAEIGKITMANFPTLEAAEQWVSEKNSEHTV